MTLWVLPILSAVHTPSPSLHDMAAALTPMHVTEDSKRPVRSESKKHPRSTPSPGLLLSGPPMARAKSCFQILGDRAGLEAEPSYDWPLRSTRLSIP